MNQIDSSKRPPSTPGTRVLPAICALGTVAATLSWGSGALLLGLAVAAGATPLARAARRAGCSRMAGRRPATSSSQLTAGRL